ncbi:DUF6058 family natural product biosynthesis protein [Sphingomonas asaccharolytica]|uniref:DUF6058 family natural product biosynthesis protein n=1 Tax=Sphingomonas asaccharolytica TaxID=40681 RepID=UPI000A93A76D|nr:DUF6058 family natural product biosynthesis protein [Sphingomonas asaccharolytica]
MYADDDARRYVERWFWTLDDLAQAVGVTPARIEHLIAAGCAPGPIYARGADGWWSALGAAGAAPAGEHWFSPGAAWGLRQAELATRSGNSPPEAAAMVRDSFADRFAMALGHQRYARLAFAGCFSGDTIDPDAARVAARDEWASWLRGGYGVCLRIFTAETCVAKEALGAWLKVAVAEPDYDAGALLADAEILAGLLLPFAPWQRPTGTPGRTIDRLLREQRLGDDRPYA